MPTYAYACTACGHRFEVQQSFSDAALTECPECAGRLRKLFNTVGIVFKGSGFYRTDSRSGSAAAKDGASSEQASTEKPSTSTEKSSAEKSTEKSTEKSAEKPAAPAPASSSGGSKAPAA